MFRLFRLFRIVKLARYSNALRAFGHVVAARKEELLSSLLVVFTLLVLASALMYYAENKAQPERFSSVPATMWWGIATITTVGYGDIYPVTTTGKLLAGVIAVIGIGAVALPTSILVAGFIEETRKGGSHSPTCPHCGRELPQK
jgi:voltage-gated potassium channel